MIDGNFALAFTAGMVATVNPCGFAMLPAYLSYFLGVQLPRAGQLDEDQTTAGPRRALVVSASVSLGFLVVFAVLGAAIRAGTQWVVDAAKYATIGIGVLLVVMGIAMLLGWRLPLTTPKLDKGGKERTVTSMFVFGVSYAIASLGCTIAPFLAVVIGSFTREGYLSGVLMIAAYGAGMATVLTVLTLSLALARGGLLRVLRRAMQYVDRFAGALLILAGLYLVYYWIFNLATDSGLESDTGGGLARRVEGWSSDAQDFLTRQGPWRLVAVAVALGAIALVVVLVHRTVRRDRDEQRDESPPEVAAHR